jgi:hypothetical protein
MPFPAEEGPMGTGPSLRRSSISEYVRLLAQLLDGHEAEPSGNIALSYPSSAVSDCLGVQRSAVAAMSGHHSIP